MEKLSNRKAKQLSKPWITNGIKAAIKVKNKLYASWDEVRYKHYRNKICTLIRFSKRRYYDTFFQNNMANMKKNLERNQWTFTSTEKNLKVIFAQKVFKNRDKIVKDGSRIPNIINETLCNSRKQTCL